MNDSYKIYASKDYIDSKIPDTASATYQQLVTDKDGNTVWEDRLAYSEERLKVELDMGNEILLEVYKVADDVPDWFKQLAVGEMITTWVNGSQSLQPVIATGTQFSIIMEFGVVAIYEDNVLVTIGGDEVGVFPEKGVYFLSIPALAYIAGIAPEGVTEPEITWDGSTSTVKTIDPKYLPEDIALDEELHAIAKSGSWNDLEDKPFYDNTVEVNVNATVPVTSISTNLMYSDYHQISEVNPIDAELRIGTTYTVTLKAYNADDEEVAIFDGGEITAYDYNGYAAMGSADLASGVSAAIVNEEYEWFYGYMDDGYYLILHEFVESNPQVSYAVITITGSNTDLVCIEPKYIPKNVPIVQNASIGQTITVNAVDSNGRPTAWGTRTIPNYTTENWTFTLEDGTEVVKKVVVLG